MKFLEIDNVRFNSILNKMRKLINKTLKLSFSLVIVLLYMKHETLTNSCRLT